jgi:prepilin-type N-terminal cleavage/methylation domain-containing protein
MSDIANIRIEAKTQWYNHSMRRKGFILIDPHLLAFVRRSGEARREDDANVQGFTLIDPHRRGDDTNVQGFTLIELLVVIAILAVLAVVVIITLNPAGLLQESRDSNRLSDMATLNSAIGISLTDNSTESLGSANTIYVSIADPAATSTLGDQCQGLNLLSLPTSSYTYHCAASSTFRNADGTGWIPVNLQANTFGSSLTELPIDPIDTSSSRLYYTYETNGNGRYEVTTPFESPKYKLGGSNDQISGDGGSLASIYEKGSKLGLEPVDYGDSSLIGFWSFDEGSSSIALDYSGMNATGSWNGTATGSNGYYSAGRIGSYAGTFDGNSTYTNIPSLSSQYNSNFTLAAWIKTGSSAIEDIATLNRTVHNNEFVFLMQANGTLMYWDYSGGYGFLNGGTNHSQHTVNDNNWHLVAFVRSGLLGQYYIDGTPDASYTAAQNNSFPFTTFNISHVGDADGTWNGLIDDVRVYNRSLSAAEIQAIYSGGK